MRCQSIAFLTDIAEICLRRSKIRLIPTYHLGRRRRSLSNLGLFAGAISLLPDMEMGAVLIAPMNSYFRPYGLMNRAGGGLRLQCFTCHFHQGL